jgi:molecular chaperone DnaK
MSYSLGIDFGTTFTAAAIHRDAEQVVELVPLGENGNSAASVVFVAPNGSLVIGDAAVRRAVTNPDRVVREVKRRIGDQTPVLVSGEPIAAHTLAARFIRWVVDQVSEREGELPAAIGVTYPASWGPHKRRLLYDAVLYAGVEDVTLVTEPEAAAVAYTASEHVEPGSAIGVYDLGGGTFDATIVRQLADGGFELAGRPEGIDSLGGIDFDEAVFEQVRAHLGAAWAELDFADPLVITAAAALRRECTAAKQALSSDTEVVIPVLLPGVSTRVRMVRAELEQLISPAIDATIDVLRGAIASAGLRPEDLSAVLLVGGSSRIPLVAQRVGAELDLPVTVDSDPKAVVAMGAALSVSPRSSARSAPVAELPAARMPVALLEPLAPALARARARRRVMPALIGVALGVGVLLVIWAGMVGTNVLPNGGADTGKGLAAPAGGESGGVTEDGTDPWTGKPYTKTTPPGPTRSDAEPATESPAELTPEPTSTKNRASLVNGAKPPPPRSGGGGDDGTPGPGGSSNVEPPPPPPPPQETTTTTEEPPPPPPPPPPEETTTTTTTTEEPPPPDPSAADPVADPPAGGA